MIFQRTHTGREEIHEKRHGLTQSERLVLIMVDGVTPYSDVRKKLPVLRDERFARAFNTLIKKELIVEVFMPVPDQSPEAVERSIIDRFLQQDPLDPVTIIIHDVEEELGETRPRNSAIGAEARLASAAPVTEVQTMMSDAAGESITTPVTQAAMDEHHIALADSLTSELRERRVQGRHQAAKPSREYTRPVTSSRRKVEALQRSTNWPYWSIGIGLAFIAGFVAAKLPF
ncbi:hypothetical protein ACFQUU_09170 [Herbaspirillum sp. GCM10030257]|uniref:hypothetical protein n=1 Tax=Herbaspirillum sp. GCM10030257 TaxID=3273393 RepID=UPI003610AC36